MNIGVVIVTFNRLEKLKIALSKFDEQSFQPSYILVVNNASTDGTYEYLSDWKKNDDSEYKKIVINCNENKGGSGGFAEALNGALQEKATWIWVSDDDAYPEKDTLKKVSDYISGHPDKKLAAICTTVLNNGEIDIWHRRRVHKGLLTISESYVPVEEYTKDQFRLDEFSYVGVVIRKAALEKVGVTDSTLFINQDDTEHSLRISKVGKIICVPDIKIHHDTGKPKGKEVSWKRYYEIRNRYYAYKSNFSLRYSRTFYVVTYCKYIVKRIFHLRSSDELNMYKEALHDIRHGIRGMNDTYKPGWKFNK